MKRRFPDLQVSVFGRAAYFPWDTRSPMLLMLAIKEMSDARPERLILASLLILNNEKVDLTAPGDPLVGRRDPFLIPCHD